MKMVKSLILGSAAGIVAMSGAQAADLPVKAKAVEYVRICSLYGAGFFYIPGTDTCIKLGGFIRVDVVAGSNSDDTGPTTTPASTFNRFANAYTWRSREDMQFDTRTATEYGVVRTFSEVVFSWTDDTSNPSGTNALGTVYSQIGSTGFGQANNGSSGLGTAGALGVYYAFIQFAGFTIGKAVSPFSSSYVNYPGNNFDGLVGGGGAVTGVNQFIYTAQFGNGVSGTIGVQDPTQYYQAGVNNFGSQVPGAITAASTGQNDQSGSLVPDIVGNIMVTQAWGNAQFSAAAHDNTPGYYVNGGTIATTAAGAGLPGGALNSSLSGHPDSRWGWAVQGSLSLNTPQTGAGDVLNIQGVYTSGATRYNIQDLAAGVGGWEGFNNNGVPGTNGGVGFGIAPDAVFNLGGQLQLIQTWGGRGGFTHNWNPYWSTSIYGAYAEVSFGSTSSPGSAAAIYCTSFVATLGSGGGIQSCNPNYSISQAGIITRWTPVKNLTFSADFTYQHLGQNMVGFATIPTPTTANPPGNYSFSNLDTYQVLLRAQRNF
jgi:Porin subfamily